MQPVAWPAPATPVAAHFLVATTRLLVGPRVVNWGALMALRALMALTVAKAVVNSMAAMTRGAESAVVKTVAVTRSQ